MNINKYTTVTISQSDNEQLTTFCRNNDITKKDFITLSLSYFEREGINPKSHESPKSEIEKVIKRLDHFFAFFKKQEQEYIRPLILDFAEDKQSRDKQHDKILLIQSYMLDNLKSIGTNTKEINEKVESQTEKQLKPIQESLKENTNSAGKDRTKNQDEMKKEIKELKEAMQLLVEFMDEKNKRGLMNKVNKLFG